MALYVNGNSVTYFDTLGDEQIPEEIKRFISNKNMKNIFTVNTLHKT